MRPRAFFTLVAIPALGLLAAEPSALDSLHRALAAAPDSVSLLSQRGDLHLRQGDIPAAITDFERMIALDPQQDAPHWRLGIAYYFAGKFAPSSRQFAKYHAHDPRDRENGIWKFMADARLHGVESARRSMLEYTRFDREPFPDLYRLFAGNISRAQFFAGLEARNLTGEPRVMFFARYYAGILEALQGRAQEAIPLVRSAVGGPWGPRAEGGDPAYMWQVARLHLDLLEREAAGRDGR